MSFQDLLAYHRVAVSGQEDVDISVQQVWLPGQNIKASIRNISSSDHNDIAQSVDEESISQRTRFSTKRKRKLDDHCRTANIDAAAVRQKRRTGDVLTKLPKHGSFLELNFTLRVSEAQLQDMASLQQALEIRICPDLPDINSLQRRVEAYTIRLMNAEMARWRRERCDLDPAIIPRETISHFVKLLRCLTAGLRIYQNALHAAEEILNWAVRDFKEVRDLNAVERDLMFETQTMEPSEAASIDESALKCLNFVSVLGDNVLRLLNKFIWRLDTVDEDNGLPADLFYCASDECDDELTKFGEVMGMTVRFYRSLSKVCHHRDRELWGDDYNGVYLWFKKMKQYQEILTDWGIPERCLQTAVHVLLNNMCYMAVDLAEAAEAMNSCG